MSWFHRENNYKIVVFEYQFLVIYISRSQSFESRVVVISSYYIILYYIILYYIILYYIIIYCISLHDIISYYIIPAHWPSGLSVRHEPGRPGFNVRSSHTKDSKMVPYADLLNTQDYKVNMKGQVELSKKWSSIPPLHLGVVAIEKGAFESLSTIVINISLSHHIILYCYIIELYYSVISSYYIILLYVYHCIISYIISYYIKMLYYIILYYFKNA